MTHVGEPYSPNAALYECYSCGDRVVSQQFVGSCTDCGGTVKNIAVTRE